MYGLDKDPCPSLPTSLPSTPGTPAPSKKLPPWLSSQARHSVPISTPTMVMSPGTLENWDGSVNGMWMMRVWVRSPSLT